MCKIYQASTIGDAQYRVHITQDKGLADLWVYLVGARGLAGKNGLWYITNHWAEADRRLFFGSRGMSELVIYIVSSRQQAGWKNQHRLTGIL